MPKKKNKEQVTGATAPAPMSYPNLQGTGIRKAQDITRSTHSCSKTWSTPTGAAVASPEHVMILGRLQLRHKYYRQDLRFNIRFRLDNAPVRLRQLLCLASEVWLRKRICSACLLWKANIMITIIRTARKLVQHRVQPNGSRFRSVQSWLT